MSKDDVASVRQIVPGTLSNPCLTLFQRRSGEGILSLLIHIYIEYIMVILIIIVIIIWF